jgi:hypothetical protein
MQTKRSRSTLALQLGLALVTAWSSAGCNGSGSSAGTAAPISPAMKKKADENLKDYAQRAAARAKAQRSKQP